MDATPLLREIVLDTETTGMDRTGDRIIEVGAVELVDRLQTGRSFHRYVCPGNVRVHPGAFKVHGLSDAFLRERPSFEEIAPDLLAFIGGAPLVIHNAPFDVAFLNAELARMFEPPEPIDLATVIDTVPMARQRFPGAKVGLDALMTKFKIKANRAKHGALIDAQILAEVYYHLAGPRQVGLGLETAQEAASRVAGPRPPLPPRRFVSRLTAAESARHAAFVASLGTDAVWGDYLGGEG